MLRLLAIASLLLLTPVWASAQEDPPTQVLITNATVWDGSVNRFLDAGGRCIEHGFLMSEKTIKRIKVVLKDGEVIKNDL